jgi:hypothetical protein
MKNDLTSGRLKNAVQTVENAVQTVVRALPTSSFALSIILGFVVIASAKASIPEVDTIIEKWWPHVANGIFCAMTYYLVVRVMRLVFGVSDNMVYGSTLREGGRSMTAAMMSSPVRSEECIKASAAHEAGHVLTLALLPIELLPESLGVHILRKVHQMPEGYGGSLYFKLWPDNNASTLEILEWQMICCRSGVIAENLLLNINSAGHCKDYADWQQLARKWLVLNGERTYFLGAVSQAEAVLNHEAFVALAAEQDALATRLLEGNKTLLKAMANDLYTKGSLTRAEIIEHITQVKK